MTKVRKLKRKKKFRVNVNRKRLRNKMRKLPNIECKQIKNSWENNRSIARNMTEMGLAYDPNRVLRIPKTKQEMLKFIKNNGDEVESESITVQRRVPNKIHVAKSLEEEAKCPRARLFQLPNNEVRFVTYMMDKYGDDYKAMVRDRKNYNQLTWRQIRAKIEVFKNIPEQYAQYLVEKGEIVLDDPTLIKKIKPQYTLLQEPVLEKNNPKQSRRKRKKASLVQSIWQEESIVQDEPMSSDVCLASEDNEKSKSSNNEGNSEKKLKLFSDDEDDDDDEGENEDDSDDVDSNDEDDSDSEGSSDDTEDMDNTSDNDLDSSSKLNKNKTILSPGKNETSKKKTKTIQAR